MLRWWPPLPTSVYGRLQAQQQVGEAGLAGSRHGVGAAAVLPQVGLAGAGQRVAHLVVLSDQLLSGGQGLAALEGAEVRGQHALWHRRWLQGAGRLTLSDMASSNLWLKRHL